MALIVKLTRAALIGALDQDYVAFARARGSPSRACSSRTRCATRCPDRHAAGRSSATLIAGAVLVEVDVRAAGHRLAARRLGQRKDIPMVQGSRCVIAVIIVAVNLLDDLALPASSIRGSRFGRRRRERRVAITVPGAALGSGAAAARPLADRARAASSSSAWSSSARSSVAAIAPLRPERAEPARRRSAGPSGAHLARAPTTSAATCSRGRSSARAPRVVGPL